MVAASPTPMGNNGPGPSVPRRMSQRQALRRPPSRQQASRGVEPNAVPSAAPAVRNADPRKTDSQQYKHDSSDDEIPVPMKLSALTKALLSNGDPEAAQQRAPSPPRTRRRASNLASSGTGPPREEMRHLRSGSVQTYETKSSRTTSPHRSREIQEIKEAQEVKETKETSPPAVRKRVVKLSSTPKSLGNMPPGKRHSASSQAPVRETLRSSRNSSQNDPQNQQQSADEKPEQPQQDVNTPQPRGVRVVRIAAGSSANKSRANGSSASFRHSGSHVEPDSALDPARDGAPASHGSESRPPSNGNRSIRPEDNPALQGSMRVKRVGKIAGSFLSGPARRGRRRQSEEEAERNDEGVGGVPSQDQDGRAPDIDQEPQSSFYATGREFVSGSPVAHNGSARSAHQRAASYADFRSSMQPAPLDDFVPEVNIPFKLPNPAPAPAPRPQVPSAHDQENELPSAMKRSKSALNVAVHDDLKDAQKRFANAAAEDAGVAASPERKPLAPVAQNPNTPRRPAPPPPPKMSVLAAATTNAGAAAATTTTQGKQRRNILRVNGKSYTRLDCLGRGGSAKVYRVTAENGHMFALKRVSLDQADETTIKGYRGEIDLLGKLTGVDRVINLFDYEMNEEKKMLTLLMEMGELDLNSLMRNRQNPDAARFDAVFVRFYWKEMLECLQSVHQFDIVHSDLKPANFVLVKGRLKLIDFGIANAIQTDETVNVHRETQIGTPNYMSPESLLDSNAPRGGHGRGMPGRVKLMKLGKPSDVWSLGCILYQMVYGVPPFGHIANPMARCQAIINWDHVIEFPARATGGVPVPPSLRRTMKRCLQRDIDMRPSCEELLHETDPFLYPCELHDKALPIDEELLGRIIQSVVTKCRDRMPTEAEARSVWPGAYWQNVKRETDISRMS